MDEYRDFFIIWINYNEIIIYISWCGSECFCIYIVIDNGSSGVRSVNCICSCIICEKDIC